MYIGHVDKYPKVYNDAFRETADNVKKITSKSIWVRLNYYWGMLINYEHKKRPMKYVVLYSPWNVLYAVFEDCMGLFVETNG